MTTAIAIRSVRKQFGAHVAVSDLTLDVPEGSIYGFIGPNGSGKTTTIRMVMNIILPDAGDIRVLGQPVSSSSRDDIGYLPEERGLYKKMQVRRLLRYYGQLKGRTVAQLDPVIAHWLERLRLTEWADKRVDQLSKGMAQKVQFISAIVAQPKLLILDEPFSGLDPVNAEALRDAVFELRRAGGERSVASVANLTRADGRDFMRLAAQLELQPSIETVPLTAANDALARVRSGKIEGAAVLVPKGDRSIFRAQMGPNGDRSIFYRK